MPSSTTNLSDDTTQLTSSLVADACAPASQSIWRRIRRDVILLGAGNIGIVIAQLGFRGILIATLVPAAYGRLSLILSIYNTVWIIGASGLPNTVARYIAINSPAEDSAIIRSAIRAGAVPIVVAAGLIAVASGILLQSALAGALGAIGLASLVYSLLTMGILRGRGRMGRAASIMPIAGLGEFAPLAILWVAGVGITALSAFGIFCMGNVIGLLVGVLFAKQTAPHHASSAGHAAESAPGSVPNARQLLGFSMWLGAATVSLALLPLIVRSAAALDSYTVVAIIDVALVLFSIPQRVGTVIVLAATPHASRAVSQGNVDMTISRREHLAAIVPFVLASIVVACTPIVGWMFDALGQPAYASSADYLALALLAGPARILYGLAQGVLIAHGEGRFLALTALAVTALASGVIFAAAALGSTMIAFAVFVVAFWLIYLLAFRRAQQLSAIVPHTAGLSAAPG